MTQHPAANPNANRLTKKTTMNTHRTPSTETSNSRYEQITKEVVCAAHMLVVLPLLLLLLATGCGPGTGGTGVGPVVSVSSASINYAGTANFSIPAAVGDSTSPAPTAPTTTSTSTPTLVICTNNCSTGTLLLEISTERTVLSSACFVFTSQSPLITASTEAIQVLGTSNGQNPAISQSAILTLKFSGGQIDSNEVMVSLKDITGNLLLAPALLTKSTTAAPIGAPTTLPAATTSNAITLLPNCP